MEAPDKVYVDDLAIVNDCVTKISLKQLPNFSEYIRKDMVVDAIKLAYGKISMNPFNCSEAFEELLNKIWYEIHSSKQTENADSISHW